MSNMPTKKRRFKIRILSKRERLQKKGLKFYTFVLPEEDMKSFFEDSKALGYERPNDYMTAIIQGKTVE